MLSIFKTKPLLSQADIDFQVATFKWLLKHFGGDDFYKDTNLILPTREFFPVEVNSNEEAAIVTFDFVKKYAGMENWPCKLIEQEQDADIVVSPTVAIHNPPINPLGTFEVKSQDEIIITYNPNIVSNPPQLVATFAHELSHYLTAGCIEEPPGGWANWEFTTDLAATFVGFGIFMANNAFNFQQYSGVDSQGWKSDRNGYLSEIEHVFALAIFLLLKDIDEKTMLVHLKPSLRKTLKKAIKQIRGLDIISEISKVEYVVGAYNK